METGGKDNIDDFFNSLAVLLVEVAVVLVVVVVFCNRFFSSFVSCICGCDCNGNTSFEVEGLHLGG